MWKFIFLKKKNQKIDLREFDLKFWRIQMNSYESDDEPMPPTLSNPATATTETVTIPLVVAVPEGERKGRKRKR